MNGGRLLRAGAGGGEVHGHAEHGVGSHAAGEGGRGGRALPAGGVAPLGRAVGGHKELPPLPRRLRRSLPMCAFLLIIYYFLGAAARNRPPLPRRLRRTLPSRARGHYARVRRSASSGSDLTGPLARWPPSSCATQPSMRLCCSSYTA
eukprot:1191057-Prorocentrum_minimum.AAC.1